MQSVVTAETLGNFSIYLASGLGVWLLALIVYSLVTRHAEFRLIREGNTAAAIAFGGAIIGLALPISGAIAYSSHLLDAVVWGGIAVLFQLVTYVVSFLVVPSISRKISSNDIAAGVFLAAISIAIGLMNSSAMTP